MSPNLLQSRLSRIILLLPLMAGLAIGLTLAAGQSGEEADPNKIPPFPDAGLSFEERQAKITELWNRNAEWVREFVEKGQDPRSLPIENVEAFAPEVPTLEQALEETELVVMGRVLSTTYSTYLTGKTRSVATVHITEVVRGTADIKSLDVRQFGGPTWSSAGGVLLQLDGDPLLLPEQEVILLLVPARSEEDRLTGKFLTVYQAGIYLVTPAGIQAQSGNAFAADINGRGVDEVLELLK